MSAKKKPHPHYYTGEAEPVPSYLLHNSNENIAHSTATDVRRSNRLSRKSRNKRRKNMQNSIITDDEEDVTDKEYLPPKKKIKLSIKRKSRKMKSNSMMNEFSSMTNSINIKMPDTKEEKHLKMQYKRLKSYLNRKALVFKKQNI